MRVLNNRASRSVGDTNRLGCMDIPSPRATNDRDFISRASGVLPIALREYLVPADSAWRLGQATSRLALYDAAGESMRAERNDRTTAVSRVTTLFAARWPRWRPRRVLAPPRVRKRQAWCGWMAASCKGWSTTASCRSRASPSQRLPWATCGGGLPSRRRGGRVCARPRNTEPTACRDGSGRPRPQVRQRPGSLGRLLVPERLAPGRRGRPQAARDGVDPRRRVRRRLRRVAGCGGRPVRQAGRRPCHHQLPPGALRLLRLPRVERRAP